MTKINVYDFDGTVYRGDSSVDFFLFCLRRFPANIILLPKVAAALLQYKVHLCSKEHLKSVFFSFVRVSDMKNTSIFSYHNNFLMRMQFYHRKIRIFFVSLRLPD